MIRLLRITLLVALVLIAAGCGSDEKARGTIPDGAAFAPANVAVYMAGVSDPESQQWRNVESLLDRFPGAEKLLAEARQDLTKDGLNWERDLKPALGPEISAVWLDFENDGNNFVLFTKPKDEAKFVQALESGDDPAVHRKIEGWTVFAEETAVLDRFESARSSAGALSDEKPFTNAMEKLPGDAALRGYVSGEAIQAQLEREAATDPELREFSKSFLGDIQYVSFSAGAESHGVAVEAGYASEPEPDVDSFSPALADELPAGALLYLSFGNLEDFANRILDAADDNAEFRRQRTEFEDALGFSLQKDLFPLLSREGAVAIYKGTDLPGVVFMLDVEGREDNANNVVRRLSALASLGGEAKTRTFTVEGVEVREVMFPGEGVSIFGAVKEGTLVVTSTEQLLRDSIDGGKKLAGDSLYTEARAAAEAPDETVGFVYLNLRDGIPFVFELIGGTEELTPPPGSSGEIIPREVRENTKPLVSAFFFAEREGEHFGLSGFLTIK